MEKIINVFFLTILFCLFSCQTTENIKSTHNLYNLEIGTTFYYKKFKKISCVPYGCYSFNQNDIILKCYSIYNDYDCSCIRVCVDENEIIRWLEIKPSDLFSEKDTFQTKEGYTFYTNIMDYKIEDIEKVYTTVSNKKNLKLKSGWYIDFLNDYLFNSDVKVKNRFLKIDENYFNLICLAFEKGILDKTYSDECRKKIREFIKKEGIPYG